MDSTDNTVLLECTTSIISAFVASAKNRSTLRALNRFAAPYARRPGVLTPETRPRSSGRSILVWASLRWAVALLALVVLLTILLTK